MVYIIIIAAIVIGLVIGLKKREEANAYIEEGRMIKRDSDFVEMEEIFTLSGADADKVIECFNQVDYSGIGLTEGKSNNQGSFIFKSGSNWGAQINRLEDEGEKQVYSFCFTHWRTYKGLKMNLVEMNLLVTAVEKTFLSIDPNVTVKTSKMKTHRKMKIF